MIKNTLTLLLLITIICSCKNNKRVEEEPKKETIHHSLHVSSEEGKEWNIFGAKIIGKILSDETNGKYTVIMTETPPNGGPPMHVHTNEDELFYVLKGNYIFHFGEKIIEAKQGDYIRLPKGVPHKFINKDSITGITMNTITPGGFENFFIEISKTSKEGNLSKPVIDSIADKYGIQFIKK